MAALMRGLDAEAYDRQYSDKELLQRISHYFQPHKRKLWLVWLAVFLMAAINAAVPLIISKGVDVMSDGGNDSQITLLIFAIFIIGVAVWGLNWVRRKLTVELISDSILAVRSDAFAATAQKDLSFYDEYSSGRIVSRISSDTQEFSEVLILAMDILNQVAVAAILVVILFTIQWQLTLTVLAMAPFVALTALGFRNVARKVTRQSSRALGEVNKSIQEAVTGIRVAKNFRQEETIYSEFVEVNRQAYRINVRRGLILANIFPTLNVLAGVGTAVLLYYGGLTAVSGGISIAAWYLFIATIDRFWFPVMNLSAFWSQFQAGLSAIERVFGLMDVETAVIQTASNPVKTLKGDICFENVSFRYSAQEQILKNFSLSIAAGESVALVGHTGAGKSSLIKLIARFYEFQKGDIQIDGQDIRSFDLPQYRRHLGIVSQIPFLFRGTVAENIRYGRPEATFDQIKAVARQIGEGEWLETLPNGLNSEVGERGSRLSMGQRQLIALTRVLLQAPRIFILDEATASVDPFTESQIQQALEMIMAQSTAIIIAHRLSTVRFADRIIVLYQGQIIEEGSHERLISESGHYADLYNTYFRHQSLDYKPPTI